LLEQIQSQLEAVAESVDLTRESLETKIEGFRDELKQDMGDLKTGLTMKIEGVRHELKEEISDLRVGLTTRIERVEIKIDEVDKNLSGKIDALGQGFQRHEQEIKQIRQA